MIEFPFIGGTSPEKSLTFSTQRTVNLYPEQDEGYKNKLVLTGFPGYSKLVSLNEGPVRAMLPFKDKLIVVSGSVVYTVSPGGYATQIGAIGTSTGFVAMDGMTPP